MKTSILSVLISMCFFSCTSNDPSPTPPQEEYSDWIMLEVPTGRVAYAVAGDIDKTLLVTTWTKAYYTTDRGKTWHESKNFNGPVPGLLVRNDTTFAMEAFSGTLKDKERFATLGQYFTADYGKTWHYYPRYYKESALHVRQPIGHIVSPTGISYWVKNITTPTFPNSVTYYINPSEIIKEDATGQQSIQFPFKAELKNLYLDTSNRLYVAASGGTYTKKDNTFYCCTDNMPAVIYVSKKPLP